ncbi:MAG TPA: sigma-70 family RNA polymerase sigma factor [Dehalococcoidia bacterium]|nr:sigma-70 family RNA polymerase sigma factor [Dehalococcoidia bacterium]
MTSSEGDDTDMRLPDSVSLTEEPLSTDGLDAFSERYQTYFPRVFAYVYGRVRNPDIAEDIASEVFERAFVKAGSLRNEEAFGAWLFTITRNIIASHGRKQARHGQPVDSEIMASLPHEGQSIESVLLLQEEIHNLVGHMRKLPPREQEIVSLKFDAELSNAQIARILGLSEGNVRVILFRTLKKLREMMEQDPKVRSGRRRSA